MTDQTITTAADVLLVHWLANKSDTHSTALEGEDFTPTRGEPHYKLKITEPDSNQETQGPIGSRRFWRDGLLALRIFSPKRVANSDQGARPVNELARLARDVFEGKTISGCHFHAVEVHTLPEDGEWLVRLVKAEFNYQEIK